jgi:hypothetical protein
MCLQVPRVFWVIHKIDWLLLSSSILQLGREESDRE